MNFIILYYKVLLYSENNQFAIFLVTFYQICLIKRKSID